MYLNRMNQSAAHSTSYGSVPSPFVDLTGDGNEFSPFDVIDLTHVPKVSVDSSKKLATQNRTDIIDLTEDFPPTLAILDLTEENFTNLITTSCSSEFSTIPVPEDRSNFGDINALTRLNDEALRNEQNSVPSSPVIGNSTELLLSPTTTGPSKESTSTMDLPTPAILDLTEECLPNPICLSEFSTIPVPGHRFNFGETNALTHLNDGTLRNERISVPSLPVIGNPTRSLLCPVTTAGPSKESVYTMDLPTQSLLSPVTSIGPSKESASTMDLPSPAISDLTEESLPNPICSSEFSKIQVPGDRSNFGDTNSLTHLNDETLWNEQNCVPSLPVIGDSTESLLCPLTITGPANESACAMDSQSMPAIVDLTGESLPYPMANICPSEFSTMQVTEDRSTCDTNERTHSNDKTLWDEQSFVASLPVVGDSTQSLICPLIRARPSNESAAAMDWENIDEVAKLNEHFESLQKKISDLESTVVDLNDDNDTSFLVIEEYKAQACQIYERMRKKSGEPTKRAQGRIKFDGTPFPALNAKLERFVNKKRRLPDFKQVLKWFKTYNRANNCQLNEEDCYQLVEDSLLKIGKKLQNLRYVALNDIFAYYTNNQIDPAELDPELKAKLDRK